MAELKKIYRGMQNGAETINDNFNEIDSGTVHLTGNETISGIKTFKDDINFKGDVAWKNLTPGEGVLVPSGAALKYRIKAGFITIVASNVQTTIDAGGQKLLTTLPVSLFSTLTHVATIFTGNATDPWRAGINGNSLYVSGTAAIRSNYVSFSVTLPLN